MIRILDRGKRIEYTKGDSFIVPITADEADSNTKLRLVISIDESSRPIVDEQFVYNDDRFTVVLTENEKNALDIGNYIFKMSLINNLGEIVTQLSGDFIVKWGV